MFHVKHWVQQADEEPRQQAAVRVLYLNRVEAEAGLESVTGGHLDIARVAVECSWPAGGVLGDRLVVLFVEDIVQTKTQIQMLGSFVAGIEIDNVVGSLLDFVAHPAVVPLLKIEL